MLLARRPLCSGFERLTLAGLVVIVVVLLDALTSTSSAAKDEQIPHNNNNNNNNNGNNGNDAIQKHPVFLSEYKLRSSIESFNKELRDLKRSLMKQTDGIYLSLKSDPQVGFQLASSKATLAALAGTLMSEQFADIVIKSHIVKRRLLTGLKLAFVKFLPIKTLNRLAENFASFRWLRRAIEQVNRKPLSLQANENLLVQLYSLINLRARLRAADDLVTLSANNMKRILQIADRFLIERKQASYVTNAELNQLAGHTSKVLAFYLDEVIARQQTIEKAYEQQLAQAKHLIMFAGGKNELVRHLDRLINAEVLDVDLNAEATNLSLPPTISEPMVVNLERKWIPGELLADVEESRRILLENKPRITSLVALKQADQQVEVAKKCADASLYICKNYPLKKA